MPNNPPPERIYLSTGQQQGSWEMNACWNIRPFPPPAVSIEYVPASALSDVWDKAMMIIHEVPRQTLSDSGDEIVKHDRLRILRAMSAARDEALSTTEGGESGAGEEAADAMIDAHRDAQGQY